ncbi:MAG: hypothetical protein NVSMB21_14680 [Vulcanimicrobiaceae bacterium]
MIHQEADRQRPRFSLIIPAHDEASRIGDSLADYLDTFADSEVILVLNGCTDDTEMVAFRTAAGRTNLRLIHIDHPVGKGGAVRAGFLTARAEIVGYVDADGATSAREIRRLFEMVGADVDAVIGSRWSRDSDVTVAQPWLRRFTSRTFNACVRVLFGLRFSDTQCGAKAFKIDAVREIADSLEVSNFAFDIDLLYALNRAGRNVVETPTRWSDRDGSKIRDIGHASRAMLVAVLRLRMHHSLFRYVIPLFDRIWPTTPLRVRDGFSFLFLNWRDPKHPQAGGAEKYLLEVGKRFVAAGHRVHWLTAGYPGCTPTDSIDGIEITRVGNRYSVYAAIPLAYLQKFRNRFDVIIDAENGVPFFSPLYSLKPKICLMFHVHQRVFEKHLPVPISTLFKWIEARVMPAVYAKSRFIAISNDTKADVVALGVEAERVHVAVSGIDPLLRPGAKAERPTILYLGRLKAYKRVDRLVDDLPSILAAVPDVELVVAGTGDFEPALRARVRDLGVESAVRFEGFVSEDRKRELMGEAWLFAMPSEMEGWGLTLIEANACGTPCVGYDVPGVGEAILDGLSGSLVRNGASMAPAIVRMLTDSDLRERLVAGALTRALDFSWEATTRAILETVMGEVARSHTNYVRVDDGWSVIPHQRMKSKMSPMRREFDTTARPH